MKVILKAKCPKCRAMRDVVVKGTRQPECNICMYPYDEKAWESG